MSQIVDKKPTSEEKEPQQIKELKRIAIVVDANAIIKQIPLRQTVNSTLTTDEEFNRMYEAFTLEEVINEIRDEKARQFLQNLPYEMTIKPSSCINEKDIAIVENFSKETGDSKTLSVVDKLVIAFGLTLSREKGEFKQVLLTPQKLEEFKPKSFKKFYNQGEDSSSDEENKKETSADDGWNTTSGPTKKSRKNKESSEVNEF